MTLNGGTTTIAINDNGVNVGGKKITNLKEGDVSENSTDAVTGKQLDATNKKIEAKLDKTKERHIKPEAYTVNNGTVTLKYVDADGTETGEEATISGLNPVKSVTSGDANTLTVTDNNGDITVTPVVATDITKADDAKKLATAGVVNTAINKAVDPLADKNLSNITNDGKKVITALGTEVVQGDGITVTPAEDATTGKKTYTISAAKLNFANGTNTTVDGDGTKDKPYKYNVNPALTGITSITGDTLTLHGGTTAVTIGDNGVDVGGKKITNLKEGDVSENSTDAVTGKQLDATNKKIEAKLDKTKERHIKPEAYTVNNGTVTLKYVDADGTETGEEATISGLNPVKSVTSGDANTLTVTDNNGDITVTPVVATDITKADDAKKLATAGVVNTAINKAVDPLADKNLSNITNDGKKVITALGTEVVQGEGVTVTHTEDGTGKKTYTISAVKPNFADGTNTTVAGDGTVGNPYKYNVNPALTGITSITNAAPVDPTQPDAAKVASTTLTINGDALTVENKQADGTKATVTIGKDGIDAGNKKITNVATPEAEKDAANKEYVDAQKWGLKVQNGDNPAEAVTAKDKAITLKASADTSDATDTPKKGIVIAKDGEGNITLGLEKADRTTLDHAANIGNTASDGRDGQAGAGKDGATVAGSAGAQGPTGKDGLNGKDLTNKVNALRNGEAGTVVYTNAAGDRVVKANDGNYYKTDEVKPDGNVKTPDENGGTAPVAVTPEARLVSPDGTVTNGTTVLNNISSVVTPLAGTNTLEKLEKAAKDDSPVKNAATNVTDLHNTANAIVEKGLTFKGNEGDAIHKNLGDQLDIVGEGTVAADATTAANNIRTKNVDGKLEIGLVKDLKNITSITNAAPVDPAQPDAKVASTTLTIDGNALTVENKQADGATSTVKIGKDGIDAGNKKITNVAEPTDNSDVATKKYVDDHAWDLHVDDGTGTGSTVVPKNKVITFKAGTGTIAPTDLPAGQDSPSKDTDGLRPKTGVVVETDKNGTITIGLEETARKTLDNAANVGNTASDGRDGKAGVGTDGAAVAGSAGAQGPTGKDGLNGKDLTSKVNALRNGEAGTVVYTNAAGDRVVKANDGNYYKADEVKPDGNVKTEAENGGTAPVAVTPEARLVSPDGTVTNGTTVLNNISSVVTPLTGTDTLEKLKEAAKDNSPVKNAATNVTDLHNTANAIVEKGLTFKGNAGDEIHKNLGEKLDIVGEGTVAADATTAANNIRTKNVDGKLEIGIVKDLTGITSITNATTADGAGTKLTIDGDKVSIANKQADGTTKTITIGKDGINADGTKITNLADADLSDKSTDAVTGKQLHATNVKVSNLEETKLDKTDDVHVKAGTYKVDDKTGTVALPLVKGDADTATGKNVTISGIVTHAVLSETLENKELHIAGDDNSTHTTTLKDGISIKGSSNFTPDEAAQKAGINIQAKATEKGIELKLSDTLTNMKGITFAPATQGGASVSLTSTGLDNGGNTITNVAAGVNDTDAVNVSQLKGVANATANVESRMNRLGAQSAALAGLRHLQYDPLEPTTLMAGVGTYKGQTALALGIAHYKNESLLFHAGASIGSNHDELMANAGVSWKFGSRADETAVKDTYRQGPISASYTLQDKVSALEAQNQMQKDEINELKAQLAEVLQYIKRG
ncbi:YadA-like family protein [Veillonella sp. 3960]|uniref:YadA-like family protein n=1 Tax=Veillonella sp. 3960 TaxID=2490955 RepID=UPI000F8C79D9|nr:YadA-like family protein [Veillonella sp. 3960]